MTAKAINEAQFVEVKSLRDKMMDRLDVLDKVKEIFMIPALEKISIKQVADFYELDSETVRKCFQRNRTEIEEDGVSKETPKTLRENVDLRVGHNVPFVVSKNGVTISYDGGDVYIPNCGTHFFSKRAVLRFGMLLRDSEVAKEVRTQLLNLYEVAEEAIVPALVDHLGDEQQYIYSLAQAFSDSDPKAMMDAAKALYDFKNRQIEVLKEEKAVITGALAEWDNRAKLSRAVRVIASNAGITFPKAWEEFYTELCYKFHIHLSKRGERKKPFVQYLKDDEYPLAQQAVVNLCTKYGLDVSDVISKAKLPVVTIADEIQSESTAQ